MTTLQETVSRPSAGRIGGIATRGDLPGRIVAAVLGLSIFTVYTITLSPDVSFWDAGEFIATSHALGIPHPPGTPLYVLMGRVFSLLFHGLLGIASPAQAVNLLSAIPSTIAAIFLYLCVLRVGKKIWNGGDQSSFCLPATVAGVTAALFASFSGTLWINAIESEVYAVSGMWVVFATWLTLLWADSEPRDERLLVVIAYLLALNIGVHLATYLAALAILPFAFLHERRLAIPVSFVIVLVMAKDLWSFLLVVTLLVPATLQLALLPAAYRNQHRFTLLAAHVIALALAVWGLRDVHSGVVSASALGFGLGAPLLAFLVPWIALPPPKRLVNPLQDLGFLIALVTVLGFSCHIYLRIRSGLDPAINEAQPDNWVDFWKMILRDQYKPRSVFDRQAPAVFQFDHMFWRYFREQWSPAFLTLLAIPGLLVHYLKEKRTFALFGLLFLWTSAALVLKMNFTEAEVRERDYFFAQGFFFYAVWMGLGLGWLCRAVVGGAEASRRGLLGVVTAGVCVFIAAVPIQRGWESHDRRGNWVAHDYAYNMLAPLKENAILFTNGDNDTFPLWYMQEVRAFRKDVRIVNLSLLNTPWYGEQLRDEEPRVPMSLSTERLWSLRPVQDPQTGKIWFVKDIVGRDIIQAARQLDGKRPVYFAVTVDDLLGMDQDMVLEGLVFRLDGASAEAAGSESPGDVRAEGQDLIASGVNISLTRRNLEETFRYRGLLTEDGALDQEVHRDDNEKKLITNYAAAWARVALAYRDTGDLDEAVACMERAVQIAPDHEPIVGGLGGMMLQQGDVGRAREFFRERLQTRPDDVRVYLGLAYCARTTDHPEEAVEWLHRGLGIAPANRELMAALFEVYYQDLGRLQDAENVLEQWLVVNPEDQTARQTLEDIRRQQRASTDGAG